MHSNIVWTAVVDGARLRVLERKVASAPWEELAPDALWQRDPPSRELGTDRPGRARESVGGARHAVEPRQDLHEASEAAFARDVAQRLEQAAAADRYHRLVLVAPPVFMGRLRPELGDQTRQHLVGTLTLDLTHATVAEIVKRLADEGLPEWRVPGL